MGRYSLAKLKGRRDQGREFVSINKEKYTKDNFQTTKETEWGSKSIQMETCI